MVKLETPKIYATGLNYFCHGCETNFMHWLPNGLYKPIKKCLNDDCHSENINLQRSKSEYHLFQRISVKKLNTKNQVDFHEVEI